MRKTLSSPLPNAALTLLRVLCLAAPLAACVTTDRVVTNKIETDDYRLNHPIALVDDARTLDIFVDGAGRVDQRSADQIREFAGESRTGALRPIVISLPRGPGVGASARAALPAIRRLLSQGGARGYVDVGSYPIGDARLASPIRLSFLTIKAKVSSQCGQWPRDLASGSTIDGWNNEHYWNYGCASQSNFAAQIADPRDLAHARAEEPSDVVMRMRAIGAVRQGNDPGTKWVIKNTNLGSAGGGN